MKKLSSLSAALLAAGAIAVAPAAHAAPASAPRVNNAETTTALTTDSSVDNKAPTISVYASAAGDMFKCGGSFGKLWCKK